MEDSLLPSVTNMDTQIGVSTACLHGPYESSRHVVKEILLVMSQLTVQSSVTHVLEPTNMLKSTTPVIMVSQIN